MLMVAQKVGGLAVGAFDERDELAGFVYGLTGPRGGTLVHWSHMLAVRRTARDRGVGRALKEHQRVRTHAAGVSAILWSFDPLVARNAHLNLARLRARATEYVEGMYGDDPMSVTDSVIGSDRLIVEWRTDTGEPAAPTRSVHASARELFPLAQPDDDAALPDDPCVTLPVPSDIQVLKAEDPELARRWRRATRRAFQHYLASGYRIATFARESEGGGRYVLERGAPNARRGAG